MKLWGSFLLSIVFCLSAELTFAVQPYVFGRADIPTGTTPGAIATGDFNGDGNPDLAVVNHDDNTVSIFLGRPDGSFARSVDYTVGTGPIAITVGDFNGDGKPDLAVVNQNCQADCGPGSVSILLNRGDGTFQVSLPYVTQADPISVVAGDFNGDGKLDLAVANAIDAGHPVAGTVSIFLNQGDGTFRTGGNYPAGTGVGALTTVDFSGHGRLSLAVINFVSLNGINAVSILRNRGDGTFQAPVSYLTGKVPAWIVSADFNHDGVPDLAVTNQGDNTVSILLGRPDGTFANKVDYSVAVGPNQVVVGDFNGDQQLDLAVTASTSDRGGGAVSLLLGKGDGTFQSAMSYVTGNDPFAIVAGDFNHDGWLDLAFINGDVNRVSVLLGNGDGTFPSHADYPCGNAPIAVAVGDFNGDGWADIVVVNNGDNTISIFTGRADGTFVAGATYAVGLYPSSVAVGDFDGDHHLDLAVTNAGDNTVSILHNRGDGTFVLQNSYAVGDDPSSVAVADLNGDGKPDLVVTNAGDNTISILLNRGNGIFQSQVTYATGPGPASVIAGDWNRDGKPDLAVADGGSPLDGLGPGLVSVLLNNGDGTFANKVDYQTGPYPVSVVTGDFHGDGNLDLALATNLDIYGRVSVLDGNGDGTFGSNVDYEGGFGIYSLVAADFNGDGKPDLAVASNLNDTMFLLSGTGGGGFRSQGTYGTGREPVAVAAGRFTRKPLALGGADLVVANVASGSISVFLNIPWHRLR
jgi:FG-GAP-like repeat